jgi:deferrochelatase/peroxidase EfeB
MTVNRVDALLLVYARTEIDLHNQYKSVSDSFQEHLIREVKRIATYRPLHDKEHFGFRDGIANPSIEGLNGRDVSSALPAVKPGEFILGYQNEYQRYTTRPVVDRSLDPTFILPADVEGSGGADFGRNGSYQVLRQLYQNVHRFWDFIEQVSSKLKSNKSWLAAKLVGRWENGAPLTLARVPNDPSPCS